ncbi:MAG: hypothetical protein ACRDQZ_00820 [Mycobacteriales bacterium]
MINPTVAEFDTRAVGNRPRSAPVELGALRAPKIADRPLVQRAMGVSLSRQDFVGVLVLSLWLFVRPSLSLVSSNGRSLGSSVICGSGDYRYSGRCGAGTCRAKSSANGRADEADSTDR